MLRTITAISLHKELTVGRNKPVILICVDDQGIEIEAVVKFEHRCERGTNALIAESLASMVAADLGLPVPEPFVVAIDPEFQDILLKALPGRRAANPDTLGFGSKYLTPGFAQVMHGKPLRDGLVQTAAEIMAFDVLIQNNDRIPNNPNCLTNGTELAIIDHELAFSAAMIIGWRPPWEDGGLDYLTTPPGEHLFYKVLKRQDIDLQRFIGAAEVISDERTHDYLSALPEQWIGPESLENQMVEQLVTMRSNLNGIVTQLSGVLK